MTAFKTFPQRAANVQISFFETLMLKTQFGL